MKPLLASVMALAGLLAISSAFSGTIAADTTVASAPPYDSTSIDGGSFCADAPLTVSGGAVLSGDVLLVTTYDFPKNTTCSRNDLQSGNVGQAMLLKTTSVALTTGTTVVAELKYTVHQARGNSTRGATTFRFAAGFDLINQSSGPSLPAVYFPTGPGATLSQQHIDDTCVAKSGKSCTPSGAFAPGSHTLKFTGVVNCYGQPEPCPLPNLRTWMNLWVSPQNRPPANGSATLDVTVTQLTFRANVTPVVYSLIWPFPSGKNWKIAQGYNSFGSHQCPGYPFDKPLKGQAPAGDCFGLDIVAVDGSTAGTVIRAPVSGKVSYVTKDGEIMCIDTNDGRSVKVAHLTPALAKDSKGNWILPSVTIRDTVLGTLKAAPLSSGTGPHLHFGIYEGNGCLITGKSVATPRPFSGVNTIESGPPFPVPNPFPSKSGGYYKDTEVSSVVQ